ncbi:MAG: thioredoxin [Rhodospirillaceae bacterium TMED167]|nr:thioredoxin [Rhodospirillaceae bacterium]OUW26681.1 MAG: thioredoxin [Rhodospirillaceae bacterium TMED167]
MNGLLNADGTEAAEIAAETLGDTPTGTGTVDLIKESNTEAFGADVIDQSVNVPVLVDFWAPWCGPCKQLTPTLEKLIGEYAGKVKLVKINVDENQELAAQMRVQSIPMVVAFKEGRPVDGFSGALPESQLRTFIEKLTGGEGSPLDKALEQAEEVLGAGDIGTASAMYTQILAQDAGNTVAHAGVVKCLIAAGDAEKAQAYLDGLEPALLENTEIKGVQSALDLAEAATASGETEGLRRQAQENPNDPQIRYDLALALYGDGLTEDAVETLVGLVKSHQSWNEEAARTQLLKIFDALGHADPITVEGRRKLSAVLFS